MDRARVGLTFFDGVAVNATINTDIVAVTLTSIVILANSVATAVQRTGGSEESPNEAKEEQSLEPRHYFFLLWKGKQQNTKKKQETKKSMKKLAEKSAEEEWSEIFYRTLYGEWESIILILCLSVWNGILPLVARKEGLCLSFLGSSKGQHFF